MGNEIRSVTIWFARWTVGAAMIGVLAGIASAVFLAALDWTTTTRAHLPALVFGLPVAGIAIGWLYGQFGGTVGRGNALILEEIHSPAAPIPFRLVPMVLGTTLLTHLFGGSAGREGTAVQMAATLADTAAVPWRLSAQDRRTVLMAGMAAGFGSVFGTPIAGAIFGIEVLAIGRIRSGALYPCLVASLVGDAVCRTVGIQHTVYPASAVWTTTAPMVGWVALAGLSFGLVSALFIELIHRVQRIGGDWPHRAWLQPAVGGLIIIGFTLAVGDQTYNGLGIPLILRSFSSGGVPDLGFAVKLLFTVVTLGFGFKGGEVTPLFCIGATLGCAFAHLTGLSAALFASLGFVAVFAGAANTPIACIVMGIELFGGHLAVPLTVACTVAYVVSGHRSIYPSQRLHDPKPANPEIAHESAVHEL